MARAGVEIQSEDGSFVLRAGETSMRTFVTERRDLCRLREPGIGPDAVGLGAGAAVRVRHPAFPDGELYGVLFLCDVPASATGPATRSYLIEVPDNFVEETSGGRQTIVYEPVSGRDNAWGLVLSRVRVW